MASDMPYYDEEELVTDGGTNQDDAVVRELRDIRFVLNDIQDALQAQAGSDDG